MNSNEPPCYSFMVNVNKCGGSCNTINNPYAWIHVPNKIKYISVKVFNVGSKWNKILVQHELCGCKCRLNEDICNSKQKRNNNESWCGCKELDDWSCKNVKKV